MIYRIINNKKGSTLLFVLVAITILSLLGVSLMSLAVSGLKVKLSERNVKESQYLSESGIDQAYVLLCGVIKNAVDGGKAEVDSFISEPMVETGTVLNTEDSLEAFLENERKQERESLGDPEDDSEYIEGNDGKGDVVEEAVRNLFNTKFKAYYKKYLNDELNAVLSDTSKYNEMYAGGGLPEINIDSSVPFVLSDVDSTPYTFTLKSKYLHNSITKEFAVDLSIRVPDYDQKYTVERTRELISPFFNKILAADGSIVVKGSNTTISGDIYAGGGGLSAAKGIVLGDKASGESGNLTVTGRIVTGGDIAVQGSNSVFQANGDVYCNNIRFEDVSNSSVKVGDSTHNYNVHTKNSIILDGTGSVVDIKGRYYGFSRGTDFNQSRSSIIINDQYASGAVGGTHINISGEGDNAAFPDGATIKPAGNIIAGSNFTSYGKKIIGGVENEILYQTGESVAIIGNYRAYNTTLNSANSHPFTEDGESYSYDKIWSEGDSTNPLSDIVDTASVGFDNINPSKRIYFGRSEPANITTDDGKSYRIYKGIQDKSKYFQYAYEQADEDDKEEYKLDSAAGIKNIIHSIGAFPVEDAGNITVVSDRNDLGAIALLPNFEKEYNYFVNELGNPDINYMDSGTVQKSVSEFIDADAGVTNTTPAQAASSGILFYKGSESIVIGSEAESDGAVPSDAEKYGVSNISQGIIYTEGDVYITGDITFNGTIISKGDIHINGDGIKNINNDPAGGFDIKKLAYEDYIDKTTDGIGDIFRVSTTTEFIESTGDADYINFREIVDMNNWRRIR